MRLRQGRHIKRKKIDCLKCNKAFKSWDAILNRICPTCKRHNTKLQKTNDFAELTFLCESDHTKNKIHATVEVDAEKLIEKELAYEPEKV